MKTTFVLHGTIARMLEATGHDCGRLENAVNGALVQAKLEKSKTERTDVKLSESKSKGDNVTFSEKTNDGFKTEANGPTRFAAWHDAQAGVWKKHGDASDDMETIAIIPHNLCVWLAKFRPSVPGPAQVDAARTTEAKVEASNGNGARGVKPAEATAVTVK